MKTISEHMMKLLVDIANFKITTASSKTAQVLKEEFNLGESLGHQQYSYDSSDRQKARQWCEKLGINPATYHPTQASRAELGIQRVREKKSGLTIFSKFACIKPLTGAPEINGESFKVPGKSHINIRPQDIQSMMAGALLVVENLETFVEQLGCERLLALLPEHTLALFRGSPHFGGNTEVLAKAWSRTFSIPRIGFYDYDLAGLVKISEQKHDFAVLPVPGHIEELGLKGNHEDFFRQENEVFTKFLGCTPEWLKMHSSFFKSRGGSFTQERLLTQGVQFQLHALEGIVHE
ncbi:MAG: hypothetical protein DI594_17745 [Shewanella oneidensis]|uniref:DUF7281 domain-containing protein n=1 Tax=Shewanella xiamenensis TaxID=332186 RepID=UPI000DAFE3C4|nr:hypothetical protein [Shewanella xiamenensis]MCT8878642.1 hypothetical protein [Shewanella xiamenensis]PZP29164.1 MAG: hypothetical protein DI594_17745 [Shewanella oneidensis]